MAVSRRVFLMAPLPAMLWLRVAAAADSPNAVIQHFYDALLATMKEAKHLSFDQRYQRLAPVITATFDLGLTSRLSVGPGWTQLTPDQQRRLNRLKDAIAFQVALDRPDDAQYNDRIHQSLRTRSSSRSSRSICGP